MSLSTTEYGDLQMALNITLICMWVAIYCHTLCKYIISVRNPLYSYIGGGVILASLIAIPSGCVAIWQLNF